MKPPWSPPIAKLPPALAFEVISAAKAGETDDKCEDTFAIDEAAGRFAVADGASSSFGARTWSQIVSDGFVAGPPVSASDTDVQDWVVRLRERWDDEVRDAEGGWWADAGAERGSYSTLLGVTLHLGAGTPRWDAVAVGDSCLLQVRGQYLVASFPVTPGAAFGRHPHLISSVDARTAVDGWRVGSGLLEPGDVLTAVTDAVAEWALAEAQHHVAVAHEEIGALAERLLHERQVGNIVNDDLTVVRVRVE